MYLLHDGDATAFSFVIFNKLLVGCIFLNIYRRFKKKYIFYVYVKLCYTRNKVIYMLTFVFNTIHFDMALCVFIVCRPKFLLFCY